MLCNINLTEKNVSCFSMLQAMVDKQSDRGLSGNPGQMLKSFLHLFHELGFLSPFAKSQRQIGSSEYK